jgi:hypothetical protein
MTSYEYEFAFGSPFWCVESLQNELLTVDGYLAEGGGRMFRGVAAKPALPGKKAKAGSQVARHLTLKQKQLSRLPDKSLAHTPKPE